MALCLWLELPLFHNETKIIKNKKNSCSCYTCEKNDKKAYYIGI